MLYLLCLQDIVEFKNRSYLGSHLLIFISCLINYLLMYFNSNKIYYHKDNFQSLTDGL